MLLPNHLRRSFRSLAALGLALALSGCLGVEDLTTGGEAASASGPTLLVATTRQPVDDATERPWFSGRRGTGLVFAKARMAGPDRSFTGRVSAVVSGEWGVAAVTDLERDAAAAAFAQAALGRDVLLYVHGYRESFETAAISAAQLTEGIRFRGATALFTWPSAASTLSYVADRESAMWSRDALEDLLTAIAKTPTGGRVHIVAHSMGTLLTLETLRMLRGSGGEEAMSRIGAVVLAAPDIDIDLFTRGVERLGRDAQKITVISATNDRALAVSSRLAGGVLRAGAADRERLEALGVRVADASEFGDGLINHDLFLSNSEVQQVVARALERS